MRRVPDSLPQLFVMAAVVATLALLPVGAILSIVSFLAFGTTLREFVTFGEAIPPAEGLVAWWLVMLVPSLVYCGSVMFYELSD